MKKILKNNKGFTLIELIVVMAIIAILAAIAIPTFTDAVDSANKASAITEARNLYTEKKISDLEAIIEGDSTSIDTDITASATVNGWTATIDEDGNVSVSKD